jgi:uncharacterized protein (TIGR04255 family)
MANPQHLRKAPIIEALIDIRVERVGTATPETFRELKTVLADRYPVAKDLSRSTATIEIQGAKVLTEVDQLGFQGVRLDARDGKTVAQFRTDGFTLNRLKPYEDWQTIWEEGRRLWPLYVEHVKPTGATRLALRYINRLELPLEPREDFDLYLTAPPKIPDGLPQNLSDFVIRLHLHEPSADLSAVVTQGLAPIRTWDAPVKVLLDIDAYRANSFGVDVSEIEPVFEQLHKFKNSIFFSFVTDRTLDLYR